jgi:murein DD-endopeptidase MepM/ murein hydrolase activator NlpD
MYRELNKPGRPAQTGSATVKVGDRVQEGQVICLSGDVGFCPTPHLHIQVCTWDVKACSLVLYCNAVLTQDRQLRPLQPA